MIDVYETLKEFGLSENEAKIYLLLLKLGGASASEIVEKIKLHRISVYDILTRLQEKGVVSYVMSGKRKYYEAANPKKLLDMEETRKKDIEKAIPELIMYMASQKESQEATIYKDRKGIRAVIDDVTKSKTDVCFFASGWGFVKNFGEDYLDLWASRFTLSKKKVRCLISNKFKGKLKPQKPLEYRYLPSEFVFPSTTVLYEDKSLVIIWSEQPIAILIRGKEVSKSYKNYFDLLWKIAKK